ncbi:MAG: tyrosine-type recombinase/integrase [Leptospiraceae bacterium]|nr:tyrosine-type recombinase/integrase [Leptospiraceae bacterium]
MSLKNIEETNRVFMSNLPGFIRELNSGDLQKIWRAAGGHPGRLLIRILWETGMQLREAVALKIEDINLDAGTIRIVATEESSIRRGKGRAITGKRKRDERWISIPPVLYYPLCRACHGRDATEFLCYCRHPHAPLSSRTLECFLKQLGARLNLESLSSTHLRDTFILYNLRNGIPAEALQEHLGYRNRQPLKRYMRYLGLHDKAPHSPTRHLEKRRA